jgi:hypothetical protein
MTMNKARGTVTLTEIDASTIRRTCPTLGEAVGPLEVVRCPTYWLGQGYNVVVRLMDGRTIKREWQPFRR